MSLTDLARLQGAWEVAFPRHAGGGRHAIRGFHFQFLEVLLATVQNWLRQPSAHQGNPTVLCEHLSDLVDASDPAVLIVTQVKLTQTPVSAKGAVAELFNIYELTATQLPELLPKLHFKFLFSKTTLNTNSFDLNRYRPTNLPEGAAAWLDFCSRITFELNSDPEGDLLALLANELRVERPLQVIHDWQARLLEAASETAGYKRVAREIWNDLRKCESDAAGKKATGVYIWTSQDRPPDAVLPGRALTGEQPLVKHLRDGYFAPRPDIYEPIADRVTNWIASTSTESDQSLRLQIYWIGGRSGAGKSVALLHVLSLLHERGYGPILWLGNKSTNLPSALRIARQLGDGIQPAILGLDDPYTAAGQGEATAIWRESLSEVQEERESGAPKPMPLFICCGPTEQAERLQDDWVDDVVVTIDPIPNEPLTELEELRVWYRERTGKKPPTIEGENVLLVQLFFEWGVGAPIAEFARRFRRRIERADPTLAVECSLSRMLALNRLYVGYCAASIENELSAEQRDIVARLRRDEHLEEASDSRSGLWLSHPHLANSIYESWYPAGTTGNVRTEHLIRGILDALAWGRNPREQCAPLWALSLIFGDSPGAAELAQRVTEAIGKTVIKKVYKEVLCDRSTLPLPHCPVWIQISLRAQNINLLPNPVDLALAQIETINAPSIGLRLTCHKLIEYLPRLDPSTQLRGKKSIIQLLTRLLEWHEWPHVAADAARKFKDPELWPLISNWFLRNQHKQAAPSLLLQALDFSDGSTDLLRAARIGLNSTKNKSSEWAQIATKLLETSTPIASTRIPHKWIAANRLERECAYFLGRYLQHDLPNALQWALEWAHIWHLDHTASFVLRLLCAKFPSEPIATEWIQKWLRQNYSNSGITIKKLIAACPSSAEVMELALEWLDNANSQDRSWIYIWGTLNRVYPDEVRLRSIGIRWMTEARIEWGPFFFVWQCLWNPLDPDDAILKLGVRLLRLTDHHANEWVQLLLSIWQSLWPQMPPVDSAASSADLQQLRSEVIAIARHLLLTQSAKDVTLFVFNLLWNEGHSREDLKVVAQTLLARIGYGHPQSNAFEAIISNAQIHWIYDYWSPVWAFRFGKELKISGSVKESSLSNGLWWISLSYDHYYWASVFMRLWEIGYSRDLLLRLGHEWIDRHPQGRRAREVMLALEITEKIERTSSLASTIEYTPLIRSTIECIPLTRSTIAHTPSTRSISSEPCLATKYFLDSMRQGDILDGVIAGMADYGLFVKIGPAFGLVHHTCLPIAQASDLRSHFKIAEAIRVIVVAIDQDNGRVALEPALVSLPVWPASVVSEIKIGDEFDSTVIGALAERAFVSLGHCIGFFDRSRITTSTLSLYKIFRKGMKVRVFVISVDQEGQRIEVGIDESQLKSVIDHS